MWCCRVTVVKGSSCGILGKKSLMHEHTLCPSLIQLSTLHKPSWETVLWQCCVMEDDRQLVCVCVCVCVCVSQLTCWHDDPLLLCGAAGRGGGLGADAWLHVRGLVRHRGPVVAHVSGALGDAAVHRGLAAGTEEQAACERVHVL